MTTTDTPPPAPTSRPASPTTEPAPASVHPVIPGFHPDPTICRVGADYYVANSSFEYAPAVPLWHSRDLVTWTLIGNVLDRDSQFPAGAAGDSLGVFAPTLRHHGGRFWLITTDVSGTPGQLVVSADDPAGPWTNPTFIPGLRGIDPDLAWDGDGACFVTYCSTDPAVPGIAQATVDLATGRLLSDPTTVWNGTGLAFPEAPHLYWHDGFWYLMIAEGGTERGHAVSVARSTRPGGPFVPAPGNPILSHRSTTHPVQNTGHGDLVQNADGTWAIVYLGVRPRGVTPMFHVNGRETFLAGVDWVDGWPVVDELRYNHFPPETSYVDDFTGERLHPRWVSPGAALTEIVRPRPGGGLLLSPSPRREGTPGALSTRVLDHAWRLDADLDVRAGAAALQVRLDDCHRVEVHTDGTAAWAVVRIGPLESRYGNEVTLAGGPVTLRAESGPSRTQGPDDLRLCVLLTDGEHELARVDGRYLSTEVAGGFTGRTVGLRALSGEVGVRSVRYSRRPDRQR